MVRNAKGWERQIAGSLASTHRRSFLLRLESGVKAGITSRLRLGMPWNDMAALGIGDRCRSWATTLMNFDDFLYYKMLNPYRHLPHLKWGITSRLPRMAW